MKPTISIGNLADLASSRVSFRTLAICALTMLVAALGCQTPRAMYGHTPETTWEMAPAAPGVTLPACTKITPVLVLKRFENKSLVPVGADFNCPSPDSDCMSQSYAPDTDLASPLFAAVFHKLRTSKYPVWEDYNPNPKTANPPPGAPDYKILYGLLEALEIHTFSGPATEGKGAGDYEVKTHENGAGGVGHAFDKVASTAQVHEAASAKLSFVVLDKNLQETKHFAVEASVKIGRGQGDVLEALGEKIAERLAAEINGGL
jgi:hypothetical protein